MRTVKQSRARKRAGNKDAVLERITRETQIRGRLRLRGQGRAHITTGIRFLDHMLELFARHGCFDLDLDVRGDLDVDQHHTVEDTGIVLGQLFGLALGSRRGIHRAGYFVMTMDETLAVAAVDLSGRPFLAYRDLVRASRVGDLNAELAEDFFRSFTQHAGANLHLKVLYGRSSHHKLEALFKCFARALRFACARDPQLRGALPSTKGLL
jgi:imidazoleglycerol-phosphate dehydratase